MGHWTRATLMEWVVTALGIGGGIVLALFLFSLVIVLLMRGRGDRYGR